MAMRILGDNTPINNAAAAGEAFSCATIVWSSALGVYFSFEKADPAALLRAGIFTSEELPGERYKCATNGDGFCIHRCKDGSVNARINADHLLSRSRTFKQFLGGLLADTRLSLVRFERPA